MGHVNFFSDLTSMFVRPGIVEQKDRSPHGHPGVGKKRLSPLEIAGLDSKAGAQKAEKAVGVGHKPNSVSHLAAGGGYLSPLRIAPEVQRPTHPSGRAIPVRGSFGLAPDGVYRAPDVAIRAVSSYLAFSPLPGESHPSPSAVCFLWHFPPVARSRR